MNNFEEAMHHGFSRADVAQEIKEMDERMHQLGCLRGCIHFQKCSPVCDCIIRHDEKWDKCNFYIKEENT